MGVYSRLGAYYIFTNFSHTFSVNLFFINSLMKKEHCSNFIPSIYVFSGGGGGGGGGGGVYSMLSACQFLWPSGWALFEVGRLIRISTVYKYDIITLSRRSSGRN